MNHTELIDMLSQKAAAEPGRIGGVQAPAGTSPDGEVYTARVYYIYKLALGFSMSESEKAELRRDFDEFCKMADTTKYELGKGCQWIAEKCIELGELDIAMDFLGVQLFDLNRSAAVVVLAEENMLIYMMLEIALSERSNGNAKTGMEFFSRYKTVYDFKKSYTDIKLFARRVWFGIPHTAEELEDILKKYPVSGEMLAVILKYSCVQDVWCNVFEKVISMLGHRREAQKKVLRAYLQWLRSRREGLTAKCRPISSYDNGLSVRKLNVGEDPAVSGEKNPRKLAVIFCTNDEQYEAETIRYLRKIEKPDNIDEIEVLPVWGAKSMASGYNYAMSHTDASYKLYIHHDTFIFEPKMLKIVMNVFDEHPEAGMVGVVGSLDLRDDAKWFESDDCNKRLNVYQDAVINILTSVSTTKNGLSEEAQVMDGIFLATRADVHWNEEVFVNWHFYDISQCFEMRKHGYTCRLINGDDLFLLHETTMRKDPDDLYIKYQNIFIKEYL